MTGASGTIFGVRLLEMLRDTGIETHLVMSRWAARTLVHETDYTPEQVQALASVVHPLMDQGATISSGSFLTMGMVIAPCSVRTLAAIAHGLGDNLVHRAADVVLKERRRLVLAVREAPAQRDSPREHAEALAHGRRDLAARARVLSPAHLDRRNRQLHLRAPARPARHSRRCVALARTD